MADIEFEKDLSVAETGIEGLKVVDLAVHGDSRGWFKENWQRAKMTELGIPDFRIVQNNITVLRMILEAMGKDPEDFDWVADRPGHDRRYAIDSTKLQRELGWRPAHTDFTEGLKQTIDWYVANESWCRPAKEATEARYRAQGQ